MDISHLMLMLLYQFEYLLWGSSKSTCCLLYIHIIQQTRCPHVVKQCWWCTKETNTCTFEPSSPMLNDLTDQVKWCFLYAWYFYANKCIKSCNNIDSNKHTTGPQKSSKCMTVITIYQHWNVQRVTMNALHICWSILMHSYSMLHL